MGLTGTYYLAFRDLPDLLKENNFGSRVLDFGCGAGRSTRFLKRLGYTVVGVDINAEMLHYAREADSEGEYHLIDEDGGLPFENHSFDSVFTSFVFIEIPTLARITSILCEINRALKAHGVICVVTSSPTSYKGDWVSFSYNHTDPDNHKKNSGDTVKVLIKDTNIILHDYYWSDLDYRNAFCRAGFQVLDTHKPLGQDTDPVEWLDEAKESPILIYILGKSIV